MTFLLLTVLVLLAIVGGIAGIWIERQRDPSPTPRLNPAMRDALFPIAGWGSLFALDIGVTLVGDQRLPVTLKHLLGTLRSSTARHAAFSLACYRAIGRRDFARSLS